jgi:hypothetical protein
MHSDKKNNAAASYTSTTPPLTQAPIPYQYWLQVYMIAAILSNFIFLFWDGNGGDIGFWEDWIKQLINKGYHEFNGNYPPVYIHWLYVAGQIYSELQMPVENNIFLKYVTQLPVMFSHLLLTGIVFQLAKKHSASPVHFHAAMLLTALNPAILFNGPIWGQIDVIPLIPVIAALLAGISTRYRIYTFPLYCLGLLTKFQMIAFAPVFGILFFIDYKSHLKAILLCIAVFIIAFLPSIIAHNFLAAFKLAYIDVLHQYGTTTMGASNIWILLTGNAAPDSIVLFGIDSNNPLAPLFKAKHFGMISFSLVCIIVFTQGIKNLLKKKYHANKAALTNDILFYALICSMAFFTLLPAMHERYLLPAVIVSLVYFAINSRKIFYPLAFSFISAFNLAMAMGIKTSSIWPIISWFMLLAFFYGMMELIFKRSWIIFIKDMTDKLFAIKGLFLIVLVISSLMLGKQLAEMTKIHKPDLTANQIAISQLQPHLARQDFGRLQIDKSTNGSVLSVAGKRFANGLGTHANSQIDYWLPDNALELNFMFGLDDEIESANVTFSVWGDEQLLWQSEPVYGAEKNLEAIRLSLKNIKRLSLRVSSNGDISSDHADWIQPTLTLDKN